MKKFTFTEDEIIFMLRGLSPCKLIKHEDITDKLKDAMIECDNDYQLSLDTESFEFQKKLIKKRPSRVSETTNPELRKLAFVIDYSQMCNHTNITEYESEEALWRMFNNKYPWFNYVIHFQKQLYSKSFLESMMFNVLSHKAEELPF